MSDPNRQRWVLASGNKGKIRELSALLAPLRIDLIGQNDLGVSDAEEPHPTFVENALAKARHAAGATGLPAIADDSGLCVDLLGGAPGVHSARFAADQVPSGAPREVVDAANNRLLLSRIDALRHPGPVRAHFQCMLVWMAAADDPLPLIAEGRWQGRIVREGQGSNGFGYDPIFLPDGEQNTAAAMEPARKNAVSHRARAMATLLEALRERRG